LTARHEIDINDIKLARRAMSDLLIRNLPPQMKRQLQNRAKTHRRSLSEEAKDLLQRALLQPQDGRKLGTEMFNLMRPEDRGEDLQVEVRGDLPDPPDFR
jgi:plasmid stability protein